MIFKRQIGGLFASAAALAASAGAASAEGYAASFWSRWFQWWSAGHQGGGPRSSDGFSQVPEIDASAGLLAVAAVLSAMVLVWELRRRRNPES